MSDMTNADRANSVQLILDTFARECYYQKGKYTVVRARGEAETILGDLLADLRHWADQNGVDFDAAAETGLGHYEREVEE